MQIRRYIHRLYPSSVCKIIKTEYNSVGDAPPLKGGGRNVCQPGDLAILRRRRLLGIRAVYLGLVTDYVGDPKGWQHGFWGQPDTTSALIVKLIQRLVQAVELY